MVRVHYHREQFPVLIPLLHTDLAFKRMRARHEIWKKKYPDKPQKRGVPFTETYYSFGMGCNPHDRLSTGFRRTVQPGIMQHNETGTGASIIPGR